MGIKLVILASGRGSNFKAISEAAQKKLIPNTEVIALITNKSNAPVVDIAKNMGIAHYLIESKKFYFNGKFNRELYETDLLKLIKRLSPDYICLAGYMLIIGEKIIEAFQNKIINIHPSLLPSFKGLNAQKQAINAGVKWTGCTVHFVTKELDSGPIICQEVIKIDKNDTAESLSERLLPIEHKTYVEALIKIATQKYIIDGNKIKWV